MTSPFKDVLGYQYYYILFTSNIWLFVYHEKFCGLVHVFCIAHILYCTNTLHVPLIIEHLAITSGEGFVCWLVLPFRERNNFIQLSKNISLYCICRFSTHVIIFFSQFQPQVYS